MDGGTFCNTPYVQHPHPENRYEMDTALSYSPFCRYLARVCRLIPSNFAAMV